MKSLPEISIGTDSAFSYVTVRAQLHGAAPLRTGKKHLEDRNTSLIKIARNTGFRDEQDLRRAFLQQVGVTPKQYRERLGELVRVRGPHRKLNVEVSPSPA